MRNAFYIDEILRGSGFVEMQVDPLGFFYLIRASTPGQWSGCTLIFNARHSAFTIRLSLPFWLPREL